MRALGGLGGRADRCCWSLLCWLARSDARAARLAGRLRLARRPARAGARCSLLVRWCSAAIALAAGYHVLGTDKVGQDVLYLALKSIRTGLVIGTLTTLVMLPLAHRCSASWRAISAAGWTT